MEEQVRNLAKYPRRPDGRSLLEFRALLAIFQEAKTLQLSQDINFGAVILMSIVYQIRSPFQTVLVVLLLFVVVGYWLVITTQTIPLVKRLHRLRGSSSAVQEVGLGVLCGLPVLGLPFLILFWAHVGRRLKGYGVKTMSSGVSAEDKLRVESRLLVEESVWAGMSEPPRVG